MKKVLFVIRDMKLGGPATSLLNMLEMLKAEGVETNLFLMEHTGIFLERAKKASNLLPENKFLAVNICDANRVKKDYGLLGIFYRGIFSILKRIKGQKNLRQMVFENAAQKIKGFDVVMPYQESMTTDFGVNIKAEKKIAWVHTIYEKFTMNYTPDQIYNTYKNFDKIACVIEAGADAFKKGQPKLSDKVVVVNNPLNTEDIIKKSKEDVSLDKGFKIVSVGRLSKEKCYERCIEAAAKLKNNGFAFKWYIIGEGAERKKLEDLIEKSKLGEAVKLFGAKENPYSIIKKCDVLVISSAYEAQPMVANEALVLGVPVVSTDYASAHQIIKNNENGLICENNTEGIYNALEKLLSDEAFIMSLKEGAKAFEYNNKSVINKTLDLINGEQNGQ